MFSDSHLPGLTNLASELRRLGAISLVQIFHAGLQAPQNLTGVQPKSPSVLHGVGYHLSD